MIVRNDFAASTHPVQVMWFYPDSTYEVVTVPESADVIVPEKVTATATSTSTSTSGAHEGEEMMMPTAPTPITRGTLMVQNKFTCALTNEFVQMCLDCDNTYTLTAAALYPTATPATSVSVRVSESGSTIESLPKKFPFNFISGAREYLDENSTTLVVGSVSAALTTFVLTRLIGGSR